MRSVLARSALHWAMALGPAAAVVAYLAVHYGPSVGFGTALALGLVSGVGVVGLTAVVLAWLPWTLERLGARRLSAWLRTWWDQDAR